MSKVKKSPAEVIIDANDLLWQYPFKKDILSRGPGPECTVSYTAECILLKEGDTTLKIIQGEKANNLGNAPLCEVEMPVTFGPEGLIKLHYEGWMIWSQPAQAACSYRVTVTLPYKVQITTSRTE